MKLTHILRLLSVCAALCAPLPAHAQLPPETAFPAHHMAIDYITFSPDGSLVATASWDSTVRVSKADDGSLYREFKGKSGFHAVAIAPGGKLIAGADSDGEIKIWDIETGLSSAQLTIAAHKGSINGLAFSPDGSRLVSAGSDNTARIWKTEDGSAAGVLNSHTGAVESVAFSRDGKYLLTAAEDMTVKLFQTDTWSAPRSFSLEAPFNMAALAPDNRHIAVACRDRVVRIIDTESGYIATLKGHLQAVNFVTYSPSGRYLASAGADFVVRLWDADTGKMVKTLNGATGSLMSVSWSPDGSRIAAASTDGMVNIWRPALDGAAPLAQDQQNTDTAAKGASFKDEAKDSLSKLFSKMLTGRMLMLLLISATLIFMLVATFTDLLSNPEKVFTLPGEENKPRPMPKTPDTTKTPTPIGMIFGNLETISSKKSASAKARIGRAYGEPAANEKDSNLLPELPSFDKTKAKASSAPQELIAKPSAQADEPQQKPQESAPVTQVSKTEEIQAQEQKPAEVKPAPADKKPPQEKPLVGGKYQILRELGRGGMAVVYEGVDIQLDKKFALKKMRDGSSMSEVERGRFLKEARITAKLHHPNIVDIYSIVEENSDIYLVFEYVDGKSLDNLLARYKRIPPKQSIAVCNHVLSALGYAHSQGVVHRDLKPSNIMVASDGFVRVMDFGIAQAARATATRSGIDISGTLAYMSPEQHIGKYDHLTDIFAFGATIYEMVTGQLPFMGPDFLSQKREAAYTKPSELAPVPKQLEDIIIACLQPDKAKRPVSAADLQAQLRDLKL